MLYLTIPFFVVKVYATKFNKNIQLESTVFVFTFFLRVKNNQKKIFLCHGYHRGKTSFQKINHKKKDDQIKIISYLFLRIKLKQFLRYFCKKLFYRLIIY